MAPVSPVTGGAPQGGLWARQHRALTLGMVLTVTFIASEALAVITVMPVVARELHGLALYGWVFSTFQLAGLGSAAPRSPRSRAAAGPSPSAS